MCDVESKKKRLTEIKKGFEIRPPFLLRTIVEQ